MVAGESKPEHTGVEHENPHFRTMDYANLATNAALGRLRVWHAWSNTLHCKQKQNNAK